jgi:iron complex outermembrane receptor protein/outer membrane receptor for ferrienterochelin and colicins
MKRFYLLPALYIALIFMPVPAQQTANNILKITVKNEATKEPVAGATVGVKDTELIATTDAGGRVSLSGIPDGPRTIEIFFPGYETKELKLVFPLADTAEQIVFIAVNNEVGDVVISSTRTGREIEAEPIRVEVIDEEEVDEKASMRSANVSMVLSESTGIKVQQTSATSNTQSIRIQGLDGRYTQILKDGFPSFGGFSGSISLLDIPPLDLKQVEIIKGPSATFFGGGAIAGVVNFISKEPGEKPVTSMIFNQTSALGTDYSLFHTRRIKKIGYTFLGSVNYQKEYDVDDDDFNELPRTFSFSINPRLFVYADKKIRFVIGNSTSYQDRKGGDTFVINGQPNGFHEYFENNNSFRNITTLSFDRDLSDGRKIIAKQSLAFFNREIEIPNYVFKGRQFNSYTDVSYFHPVKNHALVFGFNAVHDRFREDGAILQAPTRDETRTTIGGYVQDTFDITSKLSLEAGFRLDAVKDYGIFALPRVSLLYRFSDHLSTRIGFGMGYKTPSVFTEDAETLLFQNVMPVGNTLKAEQSRGGTFDINYRNTIGGKFGYSINQMFFYTEISDPLVLLPAGGLYFFANADSPVTSKGFETNARVSYDIVKLFAGYTYLNARAGYLTGNQTLKLTPQSKINSALLFEKEDAFKAGVEAYYTSNQYLTDGSRTPSYWVLGIFGEKIFGKYSLFFNAENITDTRQGRFGPVVLPPHQNPTFAEIYTHTEGRVFNGGIKIRL